MLRCRLIPSLLLKDGRLVKGKRFGSYRDAGQPETTARAHNAQGADEMLLMDISASSQGRGPDKTTIRRVAKECYMPLTVGGGIRSLADARLCMEAGADKLCLTATARNDPTLISTLANVFGSQAVVAGIDVCESSGVYRLYDHVQHRMVDESDPFEWICQAIALGAGEIRLMAVDREGMRSGLDLALLTRVRTLVNVPIILEGGAGSLDHLDQAYGAGADAVGVGTMLVFSDNNLVKIKRFLADRGHRVRL